jgi:hypothetical protein
LSRGKAILFATIRTLYSDFDQASVASFVPRGPSEPFLDGASCIR